MGLDIDVCVIRARTFSTDIIHLHECAYVGMYVHSSVHTTYVHTYICTYVILTMYRWIQLLAVTDERKILLEGAEHVHQFVRDVDETDDRMSDKVHRVM